MIRYVCSFISFFIVFLALQVAQAHTMILREDYNLRLGPGTSHQVRHVTERVQYVDALGRRGDWALVYLPSSGRRLWVHLSGLVPARDQVAAATAQSSASIKLPSVVYTNEDRWPVRTDAGTENSRIAFRVMSNVPLRVLGIKYDSGGHPWYRVALSHGGKTYAVFVSATRIRTRNGHPAPVPRLTRISESQGTLVPASAHPVATPVPAAPEAYTCSNCNTVAPSSQASGLAEDAELISQSVGMGAQGFDLGIDNDAGLCDQFINPQGLGQLGRRFIEASQTVAPSCMYSSRVFDTVCPKYRSLSTEQKNTVLAVIFGNIAHKESTCNVRARNTGCPNGWCDGLMQLEYSWSLRNGNGRDPRWCRSRGEVNTQDPGFQAECTVSIIKENYCDNGRSITSGGGYWAGLMNGTITGPLKSDLKRLGVCY